MTDVNQILFTAYPELWQMILEGIEAGHIEQHNMGEEPPFWTDQRFWDCNCKDHYIHSKGIDLACELCGAQEPDQSDSRVIEIAAGGKFSTDEDWLVAYNITGYYDPLDAFDTHRWREPDGKDTPRAADERIPGDAGTAGAGEEAAG